MTRPETGWRAALYALTGGRYNPGLSKEERETGNLLAGINGPLDGSLKVVMIWSQKGGMGKTTLVANLGIALAQNRPDKVLTLDTNPDGGSLAIRVPQTTSNTILDLRDRLREHEQKIRAGQPSLLGTNDLDAYINNAKHRLRSIVMPPGTKPRNPLTGDDFQLIIRALRQMTDYKVVLVDCGTDLSSPVMDGVLAEADQMIVVASTKKDEAVVTVGGLEALVTEGEGDLVRNAVTVMVDKAPADTRAEVRAEVSRTSKAVRDQFGQVTSGVVSAPYDPRIAIGGLLNPADLSEASTKAYLEVGARMIQALRDAENRRPIPATGWR